MGLPSQIELVGSIARLFQKVLRLPITGPALPQRYASGRMDGRKRLGGAEKARLKKRNELEEDAAKCAKLTDLFSTGQTQVKTGRDIGLLISNVTIRLTL